MEFKDYYSIPEFLQVLHSGEKLQWSEADKLHLQTSVDFLHAHLAAAEKPVYGVNTGFGSLQNVKIESDKLTQLQENLLITHAAGTGDYLSDEIVKSMMLLKILNIKKGFSAVRFEVADRILWHYNHDFLPRVHEQGSLGASGDLAPLSELFLPLLGIGKVAVHGELVDAADLLKQHQLNPIQLHPKEALALINGTQFMLAHALVFANKYFQLKEKLHKIAALSADVFLCNTDPFNPLLHQIRPHSGQINAASEMLALLQNSALQKLPRVAVQDPYSFRCIPQVHGASLDAMQYCLQVWETELNSVTDNPNVFANEKAILSGGNFHGQPLALTLDYAAMALAELANISERRTYLLISGQRGLPAYLANGAGLDSGYMIAQYSAASMVSQNKQLCTPASVDSIMSSNGQEDHVSMGANAAIKSLKVMRNVQYVLAIEMLCAKRALQLREMESSPMLQDLADGLEMAMDAHVRLPMHALIAQSRGVLFGD